MMSREKTAYSYKDYVKLFYHYFLREKMRLLFNLVKENLSGIVPIFTAYDRYDKRISI